MLLQSTQQAPNYRRRRPISPTQNSKSGMSLGATCIFSTGCRLLLTHQIKCVGTTLRHNDATPTNWETRANPAELVNQNNQEHEEVEYNEFDLEDYNEEETMDTNEGEGQSGNPMDQIMNLLRENLNCHPQPRLREFGVVLKMDWLSSNGARIDYKGKKVKIRMPNGKEIVIKGQR
ncbi:hypothetical protein AgCh_025712 [Apium graveolens]